MNSFLKPLQEVVAYYISATADLLNEIKSLKEENQSLCKGMQSMGDACETVVGINNKLVKRKSELMTEVDALRAENERLRNGFEGACYACEPVGELNIKLAEAGHALYHALAYHSDNFSFMMRRHGFSEEKKAVSDWRELFNNDIPEPNYED